MSSLGKQDVVTRLNQLNDKLFTGLVCHHKHTETGQMLAALPGSYIKSTVPLNSLTGQLFHFHCLLHHFTPELLTSIGPNQARRSSIYYYYHWLTIFAKLANFSKLCALLMCWNSLLEIRNTVGPHVLRFCNTKSQILFWFWQRFVA